MPANADNTGALAYRPDIDGLRAVAIIPVVFYHFGVPYLDGGFVGVDVFFAISGYLITSLILSEQRNGTFSFARFYERRVRRLLPALATMLLATFAVGLALMTPEDFTALCRSMAYTQIFSANLFFADQGGYFGPTLELAPLLHTWSLAVEEQFYIVWPLLLILLLRFPLRVTLGITVALLIASFATNLSLVEQKPLAAFYFPHTRVWELLVGCVLALGFPPPGNRAIAGASGVVGLALIVAAVLMFTRETVLPGTAAILPVLGAGLVIWSGNAGPTFVSRVLGLSPVVAVGQLSYAWYIWHWPILVMFRYALERNPEGLEIVALVMASFALAVLTWQLIENPVRRGAWWAGRSPAFAAAGVTSASLLVLAVAGVATDGFIGRYPVAMQELVRGRLSAGPSETECARPTAQSVTDHDLCRLWQGADDRKKILLWGDSHAGVLRPAFRDMAKTTNVSVTYVGKGGCPPLIGVGRRSRHDGPEACRELNAAVGTLLAEKGFTDVVLAARWNYYAIGSDASLRPDEEQRYLKDDQSADASLEENRAILERGLRLTVDAITKAGAHAWIVMEAPSPGYNVPNRVARLMMGGVFPETMPGREMSIEKMRSAFMDKLVSELSATTIDPARVLCEPDKCLAVVGGRPLYYDDNHLSIHGTARLQPMLGQLFGDGHADLAHRSGKR